MPDRHLECPRNAGPKSQRGKKRRGEAEVILDEEGSDDPGETGNTVGHVDHQRGQIGEPHLTAKGKQVAVEPPGETCEHRYPALFMTVHRETGARSPGDWLRRPRWCLSRCSSEGRRSKPAVRRPVEAVDRRLQQKCS